MIAKPRPVLADGHARQKPAFKAIISKNERQKPTKIKIFRLKRYFKAFFQDETLN